MKMSGEFFDGFANNFDEFYTGKRSRWMQWIDLHFRRDIFVRYAMTFDFLGNLNGKSVLDIGCGSGPYLIESLFRGAKHVTGIDPAARMLALAKERVDHAGMLDKTTLLEGYFPQTCPDGVVDFAIVMGVMDYVYDPLSFLSRMHDVATKGCVLSFPSRHWFRTPFRKVRYMIRRCPVFFYTERQIQKLMEDAGFASCTIAKIAGAGMDYVVNASR